MVDVQNLEYIAMQYIGRELSLWTIYRAFVHCAVMTKVLNGMCDVLQVGVGCTVYICGVGEI